MGASCVASKAHSFSAQDIFAMFPFIFYYLDSTVNPNTLFPVSILYVYVTPTFTFGRLRNVTRCMSANKAMLT